MIALIQSAKHHYIISLTGLVYGIFNQLGFRTAVIKVLSCGYTVVVARSITYISTFINHVGKTAKAVFQAFKRRNFLLYVQRRRAAAYGHHLNSVLANN